MKPNILSLFFGDNMKTIKICKKHGELDNAGLSSQGRCLKCAREYAQKQREKHPEKVKENNLKYKLHKQKIIAETGEYKPKKRSQMAKEIQYEKTCKWHGVLDRPDITLREGKYLRCRLCAMEKTISYQKRNLDKIKVIKKRHYDKHATQERENSLLRQKGSITKDEYYKLIDDQGNNCAICNKPETRVTVKGSDRVTKLVLDHCHKSNKIRGLLCFKCNSALGFFNDDIQVISNAADYLRRHHGKRAC